MINALPGIDSFLFVFKVALYGGAQVLSGTRLVERIRYKLKTRHVFSYVWWYQNSAPFVSFRA